MSASMEFFWNNEKACIQNLFEQVFSFKFLHIFSFKYFQNILLLKKYQLNGEAIFFKH